VPTTPTVVPVAATSEDVHDIWLLRRKLEDWIAARGIDQWRPGGVPVSLVDRQVANGDWYVARERGRLVAALRVLWSDPDFWDVPDSESVFVHGLMVDRTCAGKNLGSSLLDWSASQGRAKGAGWLRLDCSAANSRLREYYTKQGFQQVGLKKMSGGLFEVCLFQRPVEESPR
jgi:GNAT superfamily N-acetyltransferase